MTGAPGLTRERAGRLCAAFRHIDGFDLLRAMVEREFSGRIAVVSSFGSEAAVVLARDRGISLKLVNLPWLNRVDQAWLRQAVDGHSAIFTLDDHYLAGGQGEMIASRLAELGLSGQIRVRRLGVTGVPLCGQNDEVLRAHGLDSAGLAKAVAAALAAEATPA